MNIIKHMYGTGIYIYIYVCMCTGNFPFYSLITFIFFNPESTFYYILSKVSLNFFSGTYQRTHQSSDGYRVESRKYNIIFVFFTA